MSASYYLHESKNNGNNEMPALTTFHLIERLVKAFKTHRAAIDFYTGFVNGFVISLEKDIFQINK